VQDSSLAKREIARREVFRRQELAKMSPRPLMSDDALKLNLRQHLESEERQAAIIEGIKDQAKAIEDAAEKRIRAIEKTSKVQMNALELAFRKQGEALDGAVKHQCDAMCKTLTELCGELRKSNDKTISTMTSQVTALIEKLNTEQERVSYTFQVERDNNHLIDHIIAKPVRS
jgi:hypothetical protein